MPLRTQKFKLRLMIYTEVKKFYQESELYNLTGCVHKAMIYLLDGTTVTAEDIGRHNAIDKAIGKCKLQGLDTTKSISLVGSSSNSTLASDFKVRAR